jgi:N-methylhydantoinase A/oxoprolinase/acetone carboxylase beta subunit
MAEKIGIGIDAGGTYTDAVVYSFGQREVLASAKSLTSKEDLSIGIEEVLDALPGEFVREASCVALSTTLATNACVERIGQGLYLKYTTRYAMKSGRTIRP